LAGGPSGVVSGEDENASRDVFGVGPSVIACQPRVLVTIGYGRASVMGGG
jgi:hypothetical protein